MRRQNLILNITHVSDANVMLPLCHWSESLSRVSDWPRLSVANAQIYAGVSGHCVRVLSNPGTAVSGSGGRNNDTG